MKKNTTCKFCRIPLTLAMDDDYAALGDPFKLVKFAACNRCADYQETHRRLHAAIGATCYQLMITKASDKPRLEQLRDILLKSTRRFAQLVCDYVKAATLNWSEDLVDELMKKPRFFPRILADYVRVTRRAFSQSQMSAITGDEL